MIWFVSGSNSFSHIFCSLARTQIICSIANLTIWLWHSFSSLGADHIFLLIVAVVPGYLLYQLYWVFGLGCLGPGYAKNINCLDRAFQMPWASDSDLHNNIMNYQIYLCLLTEKVRFSQFSLCLLLFQYWHSPSGRLLKDHKPTIWSILHLFGALRTKAESRHRLKIHIWSGGCVRIGQM